MGHPFFSEGINTRCLYQAPVSMFLLDNQFADLVRPRIITSLPLFIPLFLSAFIESGQGLIAVILPEPKRSAGQIELDVISGFPFGKRVTISR